MEKIREKLLELHRDIHGSEDRQDKSDMELIVDLIECLADEIDTIKNHSHTLS